MKSKPAFIDLFCGCGGFTLGMERVGVLDFIQLKGMERGYMSKSMTVQGVFVALLNKNQADYISLTDIVNAKDGEARAADSLKTGFATEERSNSLVLGNKCTTLILKWSNSTTLK